MKIYLTEDQWDILWQDNISQWRDYNMDTDLDAEMQNTDMQNRKNIFNTEHKNLQYNETKTPGSKAYWGSISGDEKYITLFLLQL